MELLGQLYRHLLLAGSALLFAVCIGAAAGTLAAFNRQVSPAIGALANVGRVVPSLAMLTLMLPFFGVGFVSAVAALTLLAIPPIVINTELGFRSVPDAARDAARGMGMTLWQRLRRVEAPLAAPVIFTGIRTAATELIASATLAAFIGGGGLGESIWRGLQANQPRLLIAGSLSVAALALVVEMLFVAGLRRIGVRT